MAQQVTASVYGLNQQDWNKPLGVTKTFPTQGLSLQHLSPAVSYSGVSCVTIIQLLPTGLNQTTQNFYSPTALATIATAANA